MKKILSITMALGLLILTSCGDASENASLNSSEEKTVDKSFCDCMKIASENPDMETAPKGCEWMDKLSDEEGEKQLRQAIIDCPDNLPEGMADMMEGIIDVMDDMQELEDEYSTEEYDDEVVEE